MIYVVIGEGFSHEGQVEQAIDPLKLRVTKAEIFSGKFSCFLEGEDHDTNFLAARLSQRLKCPITVICLGRS